MGAWLDNRYHASISTAAADFNVAAAEAVRQGAEA